MPKPYGVTPEGFNRPTVQELVADFEGDQRAEISATLDLSTESVLGQLNGIYGRHLGVVWEAAEVSHNSQDPDKAEDAALTAISKLTGTERRGTSYSTAPCTINLDIGATLISGTHFGHVEGKPDVRFTPVSDYTAGLSGSHAGVLFRAENPGPIQAALNTINVIATPVTGWNSINNPSDASPGRNIDDNPTLRTRREAQLAEAGSTTVRAIRADLLRISDIESVLVDENTTDAVDVNGIPGHSIEAVIWDGDPPVVANNAIAQAIFNSGKAGGIRSFGTTDTGTATDENGDDHVLGFTRSEALTVWLELDIIPNDDYVGDTEFKSSIVTALDADLGTGVDLVMSDVVQAAAGLGAKVTAVRMGLSASPPNDDPIPVTRRQMARFDTARVLVTA